MIMELERSSMECSEEMDILWSKTQGLFCFVLAHISTKTNELLLSERCQSWLKEINKQKRSNKFIFFTENSILQAIYKIIHIHIYKKIGKSTTVLKDGYLICFFSHLKT